MSELRIEDLLVGHDEMDAQHASLVRRFGDVKRAAKSADSGVLGVALAQLWDEVVAHFATEEALMDEFGYSERNAHRTAHHLFLEDLKALLRERELQGASEEVASWATHRLPEWLSFHVQTNDAPLARYIARKTARRMLASALGEPPPDRTRRES
jgi:hemerythrin